MLSSLAAARDTRIDANQSEYIPIQELTPCLREYVLWTLNRYVFGSIVVLKIVEKTRLFNCFNNKFRADSILRFLLLVLQYVEQDYQITW